MSVHEGLWIEVSDETPVYTVSVAAQLSGLHPQTLRQYDRLGLVTPARASGSYRLYSMNDIYRLRYIQQLTLEGVNLLGVRKILTLENENTQLKHHIQHLQEQLKNNTSKELVVYIAHKDAN